MSSVPVETQEMGLQKCMLFLYVCYSLNVKIKLMRFGDVHSEQHATALACLGIKDCFKLDLSSSTNHL